MSSAEDELGGSPRDKDELRLDTEDTLVNLPRVVVGISVIGIRGGGVWCSEMREVWLPPP